MKTLAEAVRVLSPGGKLAVVDYSPPHILNPLRYARKLVLSRLEPFVSDLWREDVINWLPAVRKPRCVQRKRFFGDLYQLVVFTFDEG